MRAGEPTGTDAIIAVQHLRAELMEDMTELVRTEVARLLGDLRAALVERDQAIAHAATRAVLFTLEVPR